MTPLLPAPPSEEAFEALDPDIDYGPALRVISERASLEAGAPARRFDDGSLPVFAMDDSRVVKLYPPSSASEYENERAVLEHLEGALPIETPRVQMAGPLEAWHFVLMSRLRGRPLRALGTDIEARDRRRLAKDVGATIARLRQLDLPALAQDDWPARIEERRAGAVARHRRLGLSEEWLARIDPFLDETLPTLPVGEPHVLLHTEIMREHVFVSDAAGRLELFGLLDFEPSQIGPPEYELSSVGLFFCEGDPAMWSAFLDGLGIPEAARGEALARRCMAWALVHRYAHLRWWLDRLPARSARRSFDDLAREWFS